MAKPAIIKLRSAWRAGTLKKLLVPLLLMLSSAASLFLGFTILRSALAGFLLYYLLCCLVLPTLDILGSRKIELRRLPALLGLGRPRRGDLVLGLGAGLLMSAAMVLVLVLFKGRLFGDGRIHAALRGWGASGENEVLVYVVMLAFNGIVEELFWRGFIHERLRDLPNRLLALGLPAMLFAAQHVFVVSRLVADPALIALFLVGIFGAGALWSLMRERSGTVLPCLISHVLVTAGYMGAFFLLAPS